MKLKPKYTNHVKTYNSPLEDKYALSSIQQFNNIGGSFSVTYFKKYSSSYKIFKGSNNYTCMNVVSPVFRYKLGVALTVSGVPVVHWAKIMELYLHNRWPFMFFLRGEDTWWKLCKRMIAFAKESFLPPLYPYWLLPLGYNQRMYRAHIGMIWDDVHPLYDVSWDDLLGRGQALSIVKSMERIAAITEAAIDATMEEAIRLVWQYVQNEARK